VGGVQFQTGNRPFRLTQKLFWLTTFLLCSHAVMAQWYTDPVNPSYQVPAPLQRPWIVSDGQNGAFFTGSISYDLFARRSLVGHINADGRLTYSPVMISIQGERWGTDANEGLSLIPSEPAGTAIGLGEYFDQDSLDEEFRPIRLGIIIVKLDAAGLTGFQRILTHDGQFGLLHGNVIGNHHGYYAGVSDGRGGLHLVVIDMVGGGGGVCYNHLQDDGQWTIPWPGELLRGDVDLQPDGVGGVFVIEAYSDHDPTYPGQVRLQRFNRNGLRQFEPDGIFLGDSSRIVSDALPLEAGYLHIETEREVAPGLFDRALFKYDTNGNQLWAEQGHVFNHSMSSISTKRLDGVGGFFYSHHDSLNLWTTYRHNGEGELIAQSVQDTTAPGRPDGTGGGFQDDTNAGDLCDSLWWSLDKWAPDLTHAWTAPTRVLDIDYTSDGAWAVWTPTEDHGVIGLISGGASGSILFHVNADGRLGPRVSVNPIEVETPQDYRIVAAYPNPFNPTATIVYSIPKAGDIKLRVFDVTGRDVRTLVEGTREAGEHSVVFNGGDLASGIYFVQMKAGGISQTRKMVLLK
jgi:hypothetical protein